MTKNQWWFLAWTRPKNGGVRFINFAVYAPNVLTFFNRNILTEKKHIEQHLHTIRMDTAWIMDTAVQSMGAKKLAFV